MARDYSYHEENEHSIQPARPIRRRDSHRDNIPKDYNGGHYAESPIRIPEGEQRTLSVVQSHQDRPTRRPRRAASSEGLSSNKYRTSTLPSASARDVSRQESHGPAVVSKVTRSRSLTSRPAGISVYHPPSYIRHSNAEAYPALHGPSSRPATRMSSKSGRSHFTSASGTPGKNTTKAGVVVETMSAPNPFCPNTRGVCCLMILINLALILVAIGFIIVLQLHDPAFVWNIGIVILVFGFFTFFVALVYCMCICQESRYPKPGQPANGELYWTHHWQKNITIPEIKTRNTERWEEQDHFPADDLSDTSSRDYPRLYLESDYGQRTDREADFETEQEQGGSKGGRYADNRSNFNDKGRH